jgi:hypothetical protein
VKNEGIMKKFMVLYRSPVSAREQMAQATPQQIDAGMAEWMEWKEKAGNPIVDLGAPLAGGKHVEPGSVSDGALPNERGRNTKHKTEHKKELV